MDSFDNRSDILVEVVEICDYFDKAKVDEGISAANNATVNFFFPSCA